MGNLSTNTKTNKGDKDIINGYDDILPDVSERFYEDNPSYRAPFEVTERVVKIIDGEKFLMLRIKYNSNGDIAPDIFRHLGYAYPFRVWGNVYDILTE